MRRFRQYAPDQAFLLSPRMQDWLREGHLAQFVSDVAALPRIVTFGDITISASKDNKLTMSAKAKTYRYMEEGGAAKQDKAAPRARKK